MAQLVHTHRRCRVLLLWKQVARQHFLARTRIGIGGELQHRLRLVLCQPDSFQIAVQQ